MKYLLKIMLSAGLFTSYMAHASTDPTFAIKDLLDESGLVQQTLVYMSERDLQAKVPSALKRLMELPKPQPKDIHPLTMYEFPETVTDHANVADSEQKFYPVYPDTYAIIEAKNFSQMPYLLAADVNDYVAVGIYVPKTMAGIMFVGYKSIDQKIFTEFLQKFPKEKRAISQVTIMSSYYTQFLLEVCQKLAENGYEKLSMDVSPIYLESPDRSASGTKYFSYERLGFSLDDAKRLSRNITFVRHREIELRAGLCPIMAETHRALIMDVRTGDICQFLGAGYGGADSKLIHSLCDLHKEALKLNPLFQKDKMMKDVNFEILAFLTASRHQASKAIGPLGPDMEGFDRMVELFTNDGRNKQ